MASVTNEMPTLNEDDRYLIMDMIFDYADILLISDTLIFSEQNFDSMIVDSIYEIVYIHLEELYDDSIEQELFTIIDETLDMFFACKWPLRSHPQSYVIRPPHIENMKKKLTFLTNVPQQEQRSAEWFKVRHNYLTASNIWKAFSTEGARNQLIYSKCLPIDTTKYDGFNLESPLHWGQKYEGVSIEWYEAKYNTKVSEFGCIPHPEVNFLAASPDGINTDTTNSRYGRMVEVKNIVNREITGIPKTEYWIQMQIQMEVCNLDECDFLETRFKEYPDESAFIIDGTFTATFDGKPKGIMMLFLDTNKMPVYEYAKIGIDEESYYEWNDAIMEKHKQFSWLKNIYWKLDEVSVVFVDRNTRWFDAAMPVLAECWKTIETERQTGCIHRAPTKRQRTACEVVGEQTSNCLIDMDIP